jgi:hypothetical protein
MNAMSYKELSAWGSLVITLVIFGNCFVQEVSTGQFTAGLLLGTVIALILQVPFCCMVNGNSWIDSTMDWVNALVFILIASESVRFASQAISYRRGL